MTDQPCLTYHGDVPLQDLSPETRQALAEMMRALIVWKGLTMDPTQRVIQTIRDEVFGDTSVTPDVTLENLNTIIGECEILIDSLSGSVMQGFSADFPEE